VAVLTEEQTMLRDMAREWADNESPVTAFRKMRDAAPAAFYDAATWQAQAEMGWAGILVPEAQGGAGMGYLSLGLVLEQLGRNLAATPLAATAAATSAILILGGSDAQKAEWLPKIAAGEVIATLAVDEGPRFDPTKIATRSKDGKLSGTKAFVREGDSAQLFVVAAAGRAVSRVRRRGRDALAAAPDRFAQPCAGDVRRRRRPKRWAAGRADRPGRGPRRRGVRRDARHGRECLCPDQRLSQDARPVRPGARELPGATAPHGEDVHRAGTDAIGRGRALEAIDSAGGPMSARK
jgi:alkylation response protein AidB-like acyl-CoA dehydrogenase